MSSPAAMDRTIATKLEGDLKLLQGTWKVSDVGVEADRPGAASLIAEGKQVTWTVEDDILKLVAPCLGWNEVLERVASENTTVFKLPDELFEGERHWT